MRCPNCHEKELWDAAWQRCWVCAYGKTKPLPLWQKILLAPLAVLIEAFN